jgi:putative aldouronate transport system substrate-binding protein
MQNKKMYAVAIGLVIAVAAGQSLFAAGNGQQGSGAAGGAKPEISISILDRGQVPAAEGNYEDNRWTRWINENSPVTVKWVPVPRFGSYDGINVLFAAGTAPDLVFEYGKGWLDYYYAQGVIQPVGDLVEQYSVDYKDYLKKHPQLVPYLTGEDGKMYGIGSVRPSSGVPNHGAVIRKDWLDKFGMKAPTNIAELLEFCRRVRDEDPDGNGQKDTYGIALGNAASGILKSMFGAELFSGAFVQNGHLVDWYSTDGYRDSLAFQAELYKQGYIDPEFITDAPQYARALQLLVTGKCGIYLQGFSIGETQWREFKNNVPTGEYVFLEPVTTGTGKFGYLSENAANYVAVMNSESKKGKEVMAFCDWLLTEGWFTLTYGTEGRHYRLVNGIPQTIDVELNKVERNYCSDYAFLSGLADIYDPSWIPVMASQDPLSQEYAKWHMANLAQVLKFPYRRDIPYNPTSDAINRFSTETSAQVSAYETNIIMGNVAVDAGIKQINDYKNSFGWQAIQKEKDDWYQKNKANF